MQWAYVIYMPVLGLTLAYIIYMQPFLCYPNFSRGNDRQISMQWAHVI